MHASPLRPPGYEDALAYWYGRINFEHRSPTPADLTLDRMRVLMGILGQPHTTYRIIHVAGSKGKGSTSAMLATLLTEAGYRTGLFTSPHLTQVEERMRVDGVPISPEELTTLIRDMQATFAKEGNRMTPTFFEMATALGFLHFRRRRVEMAVIEVGLGGRLDSTNVCQPEAAIITSISFDHTQQLGSRLVNIAREKAGIIKSGRPCISGATAPEARREIEEIASLRNAKLTQLGQDLQYTYQPGQILPGTVRRPRVRVTTPTRVWPEMELGLFGEHQAANAALVVATVEVLRARGLHISDQAVATGLRDVIWPARMEVVRQSPLVVIDCAHNVASAEALISTLIRSFPNTRRLLIFAGSSDKDLSGMLQVLAPHFSHAFLTRFTSNPRGLPANEVARLLGQSTSMTHSVHTTPREAWEAAEFQAAPTDLICVAGSVFLAGEVRSLVLGI